MRVAILPARGGSVRIPGKNIREFHGKPMLRWPIEAAKASHVFDLVVVSTDDWRVADVAQKAGARVFYRTTPSSFGPVVDDGSIGTQEIAARLLEARGYEHFDEACVIYPCTPMLQPSDLQDSLGIWRLSGRPFARSVLLPSCEDAGALYWGYGCAFRARAPLDENCTDLVVSQDRFIDINTPEDWAKAESMFNALNP